MRVGACDHACECVGERKRETEREHLYNVYLVNVDGTRRDGAKKLLVMPFMDPRGEVKINCKQQQ